MNKPSSILLSTLLLLSIAGCESPKDLNDNQVEEPTSTDEATTATSDLIISDAETIISSVKTLSLPAEKTNSSQYDLGKLRADKVAEAKSNELSYQKQLAALVGQKLIVDKIVLIQGKAAAVIEKGGVYIQPDYVFMNDTDDSGYVVPFTLGSEFSVIKIKTIFAICNSNNYCSQING
jgi:hypothetical protein